jgi:tetratricopeptide (TPR) repeat protein
VTSDADLRKLIRLYEQGRIDAALQFGTALLAKHRDDASLNNMVGVLCARLDRLDDAVAHYDRALALREGYAEAFNNRGNALVRQGKLDEGIADFQSAVAAMPHYAAAHNGLGNALHAAGRPADAAASARTALQLQPGYAEAHNNYGNALLDLGRANEAAEAFSTALRLQPRLVQASVGLGKALNAMGFHRQAAECVQKGLEARPDSATWHNELGNVLSDLNRVAEAAEHYRRALELEPELAEAHSNLAIALGDLGRFDEAQASYEAALRLKPGFCEAHYNLSAIKAYTSGDDQVAAMQRLESDPDLGDADRSYLCFALGKVYEDLGEIDRSFGYYAEGNRLRKATLKYDIQADEAQFAKIRAAFDWAPLEGEETSQVRPVFIVGMPRSGTSLVEQILASHSGVYGAGELGFASRILLPMLDSASNAGATVGSDALQALRHEYLGELAAMAPGAAVVTDKMPGNIRWVGFLQAAIPEARFIHVRRNPVATCWSMYRRLFERNGFTNDLEDLGRYYVMYDELAAFWQESLPSPMVELNYERLTEEPESEARKLLEHCNLSWENDCLDFHATQRAVRTASGTQVREKIYTGSSEAWRRYESHLGPLLSVLDGH